LMESLTNTGAFCRPLLAHPPTSTHPFRHLGGTRKSLLDDQGLKPLAIV
jgi:hypothetical protein